MRRSLLFVPGNNPAIVQTADVFLADGVIYDLEDAVSVYEKDAARLLVGRYLRTQGPFAHQTIVRINGLDTPFFEADLYSVCTPQLNAIMLPKATVDDLNRLNVLLDQMVEANPELAGIQIIPIIESAASLIAVEAISNLKRVCAILFGAEDYTANLEIERTKEGYELIYPRSRIAVACRAASIDAIDTPFTDTYDAEGLSFDAKRAKGLGFQGKACIHPSQIDTVNHVFAPTEAEIRHARRIIKAYEEALAEGLGVCSLDGKMVDKTRSFARQTTA
ncbi:MAG: CoA ester lyase [Bacillus subtilis]|nr:CoA ester lyase [Bacillus subtilis]